MPAGRPKVITDEVVAKLEEAFLYGLTDLEACLYADISKNTLYRYIEENEEFRDRKELLKKQPLIKAKLNINKDIINGDINTSKWYAERKGRDEFSLKQEVDLGNKDNIPFQHNFSNLTVEDIKELLKKEE